MILRLGGYLGFFASKKREKIVVPIKDCARLSAVLSQLGIPISEVYLTILNGELVSLEETIVVNSDEVKLYPPIDGG
jgi:sulfur carrier protein ThiS